jgi:4-amino-4-deoxy-L-arabinose transferase-like glycosyltransferase
VGVLWVALAAFWSVPGVFGGDGRIYQAMTDAFVRTGSLFVENGYDFYPSQALAMEIMVVSGDRLAPQYPGGWGILAAPAYLAGGLRGVIIFNAVASALTLPLIWLAANALFGDRRIAATAALVYALATFAVDYALVVWPHGITTFLVTASFAATAKGWRGTHHEGLWGLLVAGLAIGLAINIRVDAILAAAAIGAWTMGTARRPYAALAMLALGLLPGLAVAVAINHAKFGSLSPFNYGRSSGGVSLSHYAELLPVLAAGGIAFLALGLQRVRAAAFRPGVQAAILAALLAAILLLPPLRAQASLIAQGFYVLVIDFQAHPVPGRGLTVMDDGTIRMFGITKTALLQSLPYAASVIVLLPRLTRGPDRAPLALCVLFMLSFVAFFSLNTWHGGLSNNMRYFLNIVPAMAILSALALREISSVVERRPAIAVITAIVLLSAVFAYVSWRGFSLRFAVKNTLPTAIEMGIAILSVAFLLSRYSFRAVAASALYGLVVIGLVTAFISGWFLDLQFTQKLQRNNAEMADLSSRLPADALVMTFWTVYAGFRFNQPPAITAKAEYATREFDAALVAHAFANGRPVYALSRRLAEAMIEKGAVGAAKPVFGIEEDREFFRMAPPGDRGDEGQ